MTDAAKLDYARAYLRRTQTLTQISVLADQIGAAVLSGQTKIAVTAATMEGGSSSGQIEFECVIAGQACETLLAEAARLGVTDPAAKIPTVGRRLSQTVVFGP